MALIGQDNSGIPWGKIGSGAMSITGGLLAMGWAGKAFGKSGSGLMSGLFGGSKGGLLGKAWSAGAVGGKGSIGTQLGHLGKWVGGAGAGRRAVGMLGMAAVINPFNPLAPDSVIGGTLTTGLQMGLAFGAMGMLGGRLGGKAWGGKSVKNLLSSGHMGQGGPLGPRLAKGLTPGRRNIMRQYGIHGQKTSTAYGTIGKPKWRKAGGRHGWLERI